MSSKFVKAILLKQPKNKYPQKNINENNHETSERRS